MKRSSGIICHITSLPGKYGIGTLGKQAFEFVDFLLLTKLTTRIRANVFLSCLSKLRKRNRIGENERRLSWRPGVCHSTDLPDQNHLPGCRVSLLDIEDTLDPLRFCGEQKLLTGGGHDGRIVVSRSRRRLPATRKRRQECSGQERKSVFLHGKKSTVRSRESLVSSTICRSRFTKM